ncbi:WD40 repeat-like protein [Mycena chlorophos]|uniref:WD40 repeat-like protein n=1 Tax=Mycena chlorophos TaxID=658473 RepID=A0A8H6SJF2_MYCCL|nr:WD40 repeat-like protein [Mycena chlorophos]
MNHHERDATPAYPPVNLRRNFLRASAHSFQASLSKPRRQRRYAVESLLASGFPFSRALDRHTSCVNALAFSSLDGRFLASGGDDLDIHLWDVHSENLRGPLHTLRGHKEIIFELKFSAHNKYLYSGGIDDLVLQYDVSSLHLNSTVSQSAGKTFHEHDDKIRGIATHPVQDDVFLSARYVPHLIYAMGLNNQSEDGRIIQHDRRAASGSRPRAQDVLQLNAEVNGVEFHPSMGHIFATCDSRGAVCLRDTRMAFGPLKQRTKEGVVQTYNTKMACRGKPSLANPETCSVVFNRQGTHLAVTMLNYCPTIYALNDAHPLAVCSAPNLPDGTPVPEGGRTYSNCCTIKHGAFGGPGLEEDSLYVAGSDDFRAYVWSLPSPADLEAQRTILTFDEWEAGQQEDIVAYAERISGPRCIPAQLKTPLARLGGHKSIVNSVQVHPHMLLVATSGVESRVVLHGAVDSLVGGMKPTDETVRELDDPWQWDGDPDDGLYDENWQRYQQEMISDFDQIVRQETQPGSDVFSFRAWAERDDSDEDESEDDMTEDSSEDEDHR